MYGARAVLKSVLEVHRDDDLRVFVVWLPMLPTDDEEAAKKISAMFSDRRVRQFWDEKRVSGIAYSRDVFPTARRDAARAIPEDHPLHEVAKNLSPLPPEEVPMWDVVFFYRQREKWSDQPPKPAAFVKQIAFYGKQDDGTSGFFFRNDFSRPPVDSDWFDELSRVMEKLTDK